MNKKFTNRLLARIRELADLKIDHLRSLFPEATDTESELVGLCKRMKYSRGEIIEAILLEEFDDEIRWVDEQEEA